MSEERVRGVVVGHGGMAQGLVDAVHRIAGSAAEGLVAVSNDGKAPEALDEELDARLGSGPAVVFVDLLSGSCGHAAARTCRSTGGRVVICGVNLPMLLDFVFHRDLPLEELTARLVEKGREAIRAAPAIGC
ncbi:MAG TPA: hypothetical protein VFQ22_01715 [Longimicrobiales bacterium]|nr:hypothetical protein [Longimicrobiales bacterium]